MKFKIKKGPLFDKLDEIRKKGVVCNKAAGKIAKELGFKKWHQRSFALFGGISAFYSKTRPEGFSYAYGSKHKEAWKHKKIAANKEVIKRISELPVVEFEELNSILKYDMSESVEFSTTGGKHISFHPGIVWRKNVILLDVAHYMTYKPIKGMIEITVSEYNKLKNAD